MILTTNDVHEYILDREKGKADATVFLLKEITCGIQNIISNEATTRDKLGNLKILVGDTQKILLSNCLVGWKNLKNSKGEDIPFSIESISNLPAYIQGELIPEINRISSPTEEEKKT